MQILLFLLLGGVCFIFSSCQQGPGLRTLKTSQIESSALSGADLTQTKAYQIYRSQYRLESSKIRYLINLIRYSGLSLWYEGEELSATLAAKRLDEEVWPLDPEIRTASRWIEQMGAHAKRERYVIYSQGASMKIKKVLSYELDRLEAHEAYRLKTGHLIRRVDESH